MVFNSAIFLFAFLPVLYGVYRLVPGVRAKNAVLLVFSLAFYCFGGLRFLPVLRSSCRTYCPLQEERRISYNLP